MIAQLGSHFVELACHNSHAWVFLKEAALIGYEIPIKRVPDRAPIPFLEIAHLENIARTADVGLGRHESTIRMLTHTVDIWNHHPIVSINKELHEPAVHFIGMKLAQEHKVS